MRVFALPGNIEQDEMILDLWIPCVPVAQPRPRASVRGRRAVVYDPPGKHKDLKQLIKLHVIPEWDHGVLECPLEVDLFFVFPRPKSRVWKTKPMPPYWHTSKPDKDNLEKLVFDALEGICWKNDSQICSGDTKKWVASGGFDSGLQITVRR